MRTCYICGRDFGSSSLSIHEPQCLKKWEAEMELLPPAERRPRPVRPDVGEHASVAEQNDAAYEAHETNLSPCPNCGRTFNPKSLQVHLRSCGGSHGTSKPVHKHIAEAHAVFDHIDSDQNGWIDDVELHNNLSDFGLADEAIEKDRPPTFKLAPSTR